MSKKDIYSKKKSIIINENVIKIYEMRHPASVSAFIRCIWTAYQKGYKDIYIEWEGTVVFANACVPICGIIQ